MYNKNQKKMDGWMTCAGIGLVVCIIFFFIMVNMEDGATSTKVCVVIFLLMMAFTILSLSNFDI